MTRILAQALLLDMDGTLVDSSAVVERVWGDWAIAHGLDVAQVIEVVHGRQGHESMGILLPHRSAEENRADNLGILARETTEVDGIVEIRGAGRLLRGIAAAPHALVTSATLDLARARMGAAGLEVPAVAVTAEDVAASKPHPEGFLAAAAALGVAAEDCVAFEDSGAGIAAARAAGMRVLGIGAPAAAHGANWVVADLSLVEVAVTDAGIELTVADDAAA